MVMTEPLMGGTLIDEQIKIELESQNEGVARYMAQARELERRGEGGASKAAERLIAFWINPVSLYIRELQRQINRGDRVELPAEVTDIIVSLPPDRMAAAAMQVVVSQCLLHGRVTFASLSYRIGSAIIAELRLESLRYKREDEKDERIRKVQKRQFLRKTRRHVNAAFINQNLKRDDESQRHKRRSRTILGAQLYWAIQTTAGLPNDDLESPFRLAFHHGKVSKKGKSVGMVEMDGEAIAIIERGHAARARLRPKYLPMIVPAYSWLLDPKTHEVVEGGYARIRTPFISRPTREQKDALKRGDLDLVFEGVGALGRTAWRVCGPMLDFQAEAFNRDWTEVGVPVRDPIPLPPFPNGEIPGDSREERREQIRRNRELDPDKTLDWKMDAREVFNRNKENRSDRENFHRCNAVATRFRDRKKVYLPHQLCSRGRAYPIPQYWNHHNSDTSRSLMEFGSEFEMTPDGLEWLKIHTANCFGIDKVSYDARVDWVDGHLDDILASAQDPHANTWWTTGDKKTRLQFLQACMALADPHGAGTRLPVQMDGTANGMQHYALLGRDPQAAVQVNVLPGPEPADLYSVVERATEERVNHDASRDWTFQHGMYRRMGEEPVPRVMDGRKVAELAQEALCRNLVKQPVMTDVYGVTMVGARSQIFKHEILDGMKIDKADRFMLSAYLARLVLGAIADVAPKVREIQAWLTMIADEYVKDGEPVRWTSPIGLPCVQSYRLPHTEDVQTIMQTVTLGFDDAGKPVRKKKQKNAFAPNYIHSIDAAHMMMTAIACEREGIPFGMVHDSYWTVPMHAARLAVILREQAVKLHERPLLLELHAETERNLKRSIKPPPEPGDLDISCLMGSKYFFH